MSFNNLGISVPIYVTRQSANGETGSYFISLWVSLLCILIAILNIVLWGGIGIYEAISRII